MTTISVINKSSIEPVPANAVALMARAVHEQFERDFAPDWGLAKESYEVTDREGGEIVALIIDDDPNAPGALAYHDDPNAKPDIVILAKTILDNGGTWLDGSVSVSGALSHEVLELIADPSCNEMADDGQGQSYAIEVCDPIEEHAYVIEVDGVPVAVSNYVTRHWFDPAAVDVQFDKLRVLSAPFSLDGGYAITEQVGQGSQITGEMAPWRHEVRTEGNPFSRTYRRLHEAHADAEQAPADTTDSEYREATIVEEDGEPVTPREVRILR